MTYKRGAAVASTVQLEAKYVKIAAMIIHRSQALCQIA